MSVKPQLVTTKEKVNTLLKAKRLSLSKLATELGERKQTVAYRLDKPDSPTDETFWPRMAAKLGVSQDVLLKEEEQLPDWAFASGSTVQSRLPVHSSLLDMLFDILENPNEPNERKETARATIRLWLQDFIH